MVNGIKTTVSINFGFETPETLERILSNIRFIGENLPPINPDYGPLQVAYRSIYVKGRGIVLPVLPFDQGGSVTREYLIKDWVRKRGDFYRGNSIVGERLYTEEQIESVQTAIKNGWGGEESTLLDSIGNCEAVMPKHPDFRPSS